MTDAQFEELKTARLREKYCSLGKMFDAERRLSDALAEALRGMWAEYRTGQRYREPVSSAPATAALSRYDAARGGK